MSKLNLGKRAYTVFLLYATTAIALHAQTYALLHSFGGGAGGANPYAALVQGTDGNLYGTTVGGGVNDAGTIFKITPGGTFTTLHRFCSQSGCGTSPTGLVQAPNGDFYGTTQSGGIYGSGTVFKVTPGGTLTTLYSFAPKADAPTVPCPSPVWSRPPMETSTGQRTMAAPTVPPWVVGRSSKSPRVAR